VERASWVIDRTGGELGHVYGELAAEPYQTLYVEFRGRPVARPVNGFGADYAQAVEVLELRRAAREAAGCGEDLTGVEFLARGNEPFWSLEIRDNGIVLRQLGRGDLRFAYTAPEVQGRIKIYRASGAAGPPAEIQVELAEAPCIDSMSGERHPFEARVEHGTGLLTGCALEGWPEISRTRDAE